MKAIKVIEEALKTKENFNRFCMIIQSNDKNENKSLIDEKKNQTKMSVRKRDEYLCNFCKRNVFNVSKSNTLHHVIPVRYSGKHELDNLITICNDCHNKLENYIKIVERQAIKHTLNHLRKVQTSNEK
jgi:5-methylcytosine-specific restriction endonuclease McrA